MKPKTLIPLLTIDAAALVAFYLTRLEQNALVLAGLCVGSILASVAINRLLPSGSAKVRALVSTGVFTAFYVVLIVIVSQPEVLAAVAANSAWISGEHVTVSLDQPVQSALTGIAGCLVAHWLGLGVNGETRRARELLKAPPSEAAHA